MRESRSRERARVPFKEKPVQALLRRQFRSSAIGIASLSLLGSSTAALAQAPITLPEIHVEGQADPGFRTESTRSATRTDTPLRDIPQFINMVPQALIRSQNATTLSDALRNVPGISYAAGEGGTQANQVFYLRGFPLNEDIFIDGVRDLGEYNRDLFATESIEVLKGSSALAFGRGSPAGVINQTTKLADRMPRAEVGLTLGSFSQKRATGDYNVPLGDSSAFRVVAVAEKSGSFRYPQDVENYGVAPSFWTKLGPATDLTASYYYLNQSSVTDYGQPTLYTAALGFFGFAPISPRKYYGYENSDFARYQTNIATLKLEHAFNQAVSLRETLRWASYKRQSESTIPSLAATDANGNPLTTSTPPSLMLVTRNHDTNRSRDNDDTALISQTELTWKVATGSVQHTILGGVELARERLDRRNFLLDANPALAGVQAPTSTTPLLDPDPTTPLSYTKTPNLNALADGDTVSTYVQDQVELSSQWKALAGLRWEHFDARAETVALSPTPSAAPTGPFERTDRMLSGRAGLIWQPTSSQSYYVSWGNSFNPSGELGVYAGTAQTNLSPVNEDLGPEKNVNYELGAQWDVLSGLQLRSAVFRNEKTNARMNDPSGVTVLAGKRRVEGIEFEASGSLTANWDLYSGIAFMRGDIVTGPANVQGNTPLGVARVTGNVWSVYRLGAGWEVGGGLRGQRGTWLTDTNLPGSQIPGYVVFDGTVAYVQPRYEVRLNLYNIGDKDYLIGGYNNSPSRVLPGTPRMASVTLRYNFN